MPSRSYPPAGRSTTIGRNLTHHVRGIFERCQGYAHGSEPNRTTVLNTHDYLPAPVSIIQWLSNSSRHFYELSKIFLPLSFHNQIH